MHSGLGALAVDDCRRGAGVAPNPFAICHHERVVYPFKAHIVSPGGEPAVNRPPWWQVVRQQPPRAARPQDRTRFERRFSREADALQTIAVEASKPLKGKCQMVTEDERYAVADRAVAQLKERSDPWRLNEEAPAAKPPST